MHRSARLSTLLAIVLVMFLALPASAYWVWSDWRAAERRAQAIDITGGDPDRGPALMLVNGCAGCHEIPGVPMAIGRVGPSLEGLRLQAYFGGVLKNNPENLELWIRSAQDIDPATAMPNIPLRDQEARDIAAYLYSLR